MAAYGCRLGLVASGELVSAARCHQGHIFVSFRRSAGCPRHVLPPAGIQAGFHLLRLLP